MPQQPYANKNKPVKDFAYDYQSMQLQKMEGEMKEMQMELEEIRRIRRDSLDAKIESEVMETNSEVDCKPEKFLNEDLEITNIREALIRAKTAAEDERFKRLQCVGKLNDLEIRLNNLCAISKISETKESRKSTDDAILALKMQIRDLKEQIEEMHITLSDKTEELEEYRAKYHQAQAQVEEMTTRINVMDSENKQASSQIEIELQNMKMQFQTKLIELAPLPDLLKGAKLQLQEAKQLQKLAEDNAQQISNELHRVKEKAYTLKKFTQLVIAVNTINQEKMERNQLMEELNTLKIEVEDRIENEKQLISMIDDYKCQVVRLEEKLVQQERMYEDKVSENLNLLRDLEELKDEKSRALCRYKERTDSSRHYMQTQIAGLESQLISCKAQCRAYQKERDDIRQRMKIQVSGLKENFDMMELRVKSLQGQIGMLKHGCSMSPAFVLGTDEDS